MAILSGLSSSILCSIGANVIYDSAQQLHTQYLNQGADRELLQELTEYLETQVDRSLALNTETEPFRQFLRTPQVADLLRDYILYCISGVLPEPLYQVKRDEFLSEADVIHFLCEALLAQRAGALRSISTVDFQRYLRFLFSSAQAFFAAKLSTDQQFMLFDLNRNFNQRFTLLMEKLNALPAKLKKVLESEYVPTSGAYEQVRQRYNKMMRQLFQQDKIYLLGEYEFSKFYIPPALRPGQDPQIYHGHRLSRSDPPCPWSDIFCGRDIIYVVGGPGYGKSLFLRNLINNFAKLNISDSEGHLVIYCDLKSFYTDGNPARKSIVDFLQESMIKHTGMDGEVLSKSLIQYYLDLGRCLILCDALDEVPKEYRPSLHKKLVNYFQTVNPNNKVCITSRDRGFLPQIGITTFEICPLDLGDIDAYLDKMIAIKKFKQEDKSRFLQQAATLIGKEFLNNFLVLSLLVGIYRSEWELPESKIALYKKCFEYIAKKREEEKSKTLYDWVHLNPILKESTFISLSVLSAPNNSVITGEQVEELLLSQYKNKYPDECVAEEAVRGFLEFCCNRTELFVPAEGDDQYKFFHRSFFEYFYSLYIYQQPDVDEMCRLMAQFDLDSEVFELTVAHVKEVNELKYQELISRLFDRSEAGLAAQPPQYQPFHILTLSMQVVDDAAFLRRYLDLTIRYNAVLPESGMMPTAHVLTSRQIERALHLLPDQREVFSAAYEKRSVSDLLRALGSIPKQDLTELLAETTEMGKKPTHTLQIPITINNFQLMLECTTFYTIVLRDTSPAPQTLAQTVDSYCAADLAQLLQRLGVWRKGRAKLKRGYTLYRRIPQVAHTALLQGLMLY